MRVFCVLSIVTLAYLAPAQSAEPSPVKWQQGENTKSEPKPHDQTGQGSRNRLEDGWIGDGRASDGTLLGMGVYKTSKGIKVGFAHGEFPTVEAAQNERHIWLRNAARIVEKGLVRNDSGEIVGDRIVAYFPKTRGWDEFYAIAWISDREFHWVASPSFQIALETEAKFKKDSSERGSVKLRWLPAPGPSSLPTPEIEDGLAGHRTSVRR